MSANRVKSRSLLGRYINEFVAYKRALGRKYDNEEKGLHLLDRYLAEHKVRRLYQVTPMLLNAFLVSRPRPRPRSYNHLAGTLHRFFNWLVVQGVIDRLPLEYHPKRQNDPRRPFIFDAPAAKRLLDLASVIQSDACCRHRGLAYKTIFAVLYGLGLRVGEVTRLLVKDLDLDRDLLVIRETKFYKSRLVPFGQRLGALLREYLRARAAEAGRLSNEAPLFSLWRGRAVDISTINLTFRSLIAKLNLQVPPGTSRPRVHDLRHSFAVGTLLRWYRSGVDVGARLLRLSTFLGHVNVAATAVYLTITDALLQEANRRFEAFAKAALTERAVS